ncbi:MAG: iron-sulfur cluster repair di-iron protein [Balneolaceae bacterium]|nr:iron-sulfur cluster repair di-iron protein [Balneolaceae bacterium]
MMNNENLASKRIGDIVTENYHAAGVFKEFGIDFCCGGGKSLNEVCQKRDIALEEVVGKLLDIADSNTSGDHNYSEWEADFLIDYIINTHHSFVRKKTDEISAYAAKVARVYGEQYPENVEIFKSFVTLSNELTEHLEAEEATVFPLIKNISAKLKNGESLLEAEKEKLKGQLTLMEDDHDGAGQVMANIRKLSNDFTPPADACKTYQILYQNLAGFEEDLHKHVHLENNILFKKAEKLIAA